VDRDEQPASSSQEKNGVVDARRAELESALVRSERRLSAMFDAMPNPAFVFTEDRKCVRINEAFCRTFGVHETDLLCENLSIESISSHSIYSSNSGRLAILIKQALLGQPIEFEWTHRRVDTGSAFESQVTLQRYQEATSTQPVLLLAIVRDLSDAKRLEQDRQQIQDELTQANKRLESMAFVDVLTGLHNRRYFEKVLQDRCAETLRYGNPIGCVLVDIDHLRPINEAFGHDVGDAVLKQIADQLAHEAREVDIVTRFSGEKFALLLPQAGLPEAVIMAERVCRNLAALGFPDIPDRRQLTVSIGVSCADSSPRADAKMLLNTATQALEMSKENGRNRVTSLACGG
jgi:diguanylate cyclase (GGDEF)-like protein/PAS domain S-box-containing protein